MESFYIRLYRYLICGPDDPPYISRILLTTVVFIALNISAFPRFLPQNLSVFLVVSDMNVMLGTKLIEFNFGGNGRVANITKENEGILAMLSGAEGDPSKSRRSCLDYYVKAVKGFIPDYVRIIKKMTDIVYMDYVDNRQGLLKSEYPLIMWWGYSGLYNDVAVENSSKEPVAIGELCNVYFFNLKLFENIFNGENAEKLLLYFQLKELPKLPNETWGVPGGEVYTKYDFSGYQHHNLWGVYGYDFTTRLIHASGEYFSGGRLKQNLLAYQDGIILNAITGTHLGTPDTVVPPRRQKRYAPWLLYSNCGDTVQALSDARFLLYSERASRHLLLDG